MLHVSEVSFKWTAMCAARLNTESSKDLRLYAQVVIETVYVIISCCNLVEDRKNCSKVRAKGAARLLFPHSSNRSNS